MKISLAHRETSLTPPSVFNIHIRNELYNLGFHAMLEKLSPIIKLYLIEMGRAADWNRFVNVSRMVSKIFAETVAIFMCIFCLNVTFLFSIALRFLKLS